MDIYITNEFLRSLAVFSAITTTVVYVVFAGFLFGPMKETVSKLGTGWLVNLVVVLVGYAIVEAVVAVDIAERPYSPILAVILPVVAIFHLRLLLLSSGATATLRDLTK